MALTLPEVAPGCQIEIPVLTLPPLPLLEVIRSLCQQQRIVPRILEVVLYSIKLKNVAV
jgi:hypothetical protein